MEKLEQLSSAQTFEVKPLAKGALPAKPTSEIDAFRKMFQEFQQDITATNSVLDKGISKVNAMERALNEAERPSAELTSRIHAAKSQLQSLKKQMGGSPSKNEVGEKNPPSPGDGSFVGQVALGNTYGPTGNHKAAMQRAQNQLKGIKAALGTLTKSTLPALESALKAAGAPWIQGQGLIED